MEPNNLDLIFVTIGVPFSKIPIMQKVMVFVDLEAGETQAQAAKKLRKKVADNIENHGWVKGTNFNPSELYYEAYAKAENNYPFLMSANAPCLNQAA